jgi:hypothetical protein
MTANAIDERGSPIKSDSHAESHRNDCGFYVAARIYLLPQLGRLRPRTGVDSNLVAALFASSRFNVFDSRRDLPRLAGTVCVPGGVGGLAYRCFGFRRYLSRFSQFDLRAAFGLGLQCVWLNRFARGDYPGDCLQRA